MDDISVLQKLRNDDVFSLFLTNNFDVKAITSSAVQLVAVTEHLAKLSSGILLLDKDLHCQVANQYEDLLSQATKIETLESVLLMVKSRIESLMCSADKLFQNIAEPYEAVSSQTTMLLRLQTTCDLLRRIIRVKQLSHRLDVLLEGETCEITKAAKVLNELDYVMENVSLDGLHVIDANLQRVKRAREKVLNDGHILLMKGMDSENYFDTETALHVFNSLRILSATIEQVLKLKKDKLGQNIQHALSVVFHHEGPQNDNSRKVNVPGRIITPFSGNTAAFRSILWCNMSHLMSVISKTFYQIHHLHTILSSKRDPVSHKLLIEEMRATGYNNIDDTFWEIVIKMLTIEFSAAAEESSGIKQAFEVEFPKLLCMFNDLMENLHQHGCDVGSNNCEKSNNLPGKNLSHALLPFESAYLSRCLSHLTDSVNVIYGEEAPTVNDIERIVNAIESELSAASVDQILLEKVAINVGKILSSFVENCHFLISTNGDAVQVIDLPNQSQLLNANMIHLLHLLQTRITQVLQQSNYTKNAKTAIENSLLPILTLMKIAIDPLLQAVSSAVEAIIMTMHKEDYSMNTLDEISKEYDSPCSLFMKELQNFIGRSQKNYFSLYPDCQVITLGIRELACRAVKFFIRHASLIRPIGEGGKMRVAADCAQMELVVTPWCQRIGDLGSAYRLLRAFRPMLFQTASHIAESPALGDTVPYSVVLHFLFSRGPAEFESPYKVAGYSFEEYSQWLDDHSEKAILILIKTSLEKYVNWVKQRQNKEFCAIYPTIYALLQKALETHL